MSEERKREDSRFGGQVSRLQVAWVCREAVQAPEKSRNKLVEVVAEAGAPATPIGKQLDRIKAGAPAAPEPGTAAAYDAKYAFTESASQRFVSLMAADGALPEVLNGRLAMVGFAAALLAEKASSRYEAPPPNPPRHRAPRSGIVLYTH